MINSKLDGFNYYYTNNILSNQTCYSEGLKNGLDIYYKNSKIKSVYCYKKDRLDGFYSVFYDDGSIKENGIYKANILFGKFCFAKGERESDIRVQVFPCVSKRARERGASGPP